MNFAVDEIPAAFASFSSSATIFALSSSSRRTLPRSAAERFATIQTSWPPLRPPSCHATAPTSRSSSSPSSAVPVTHGTTMLSSAPSVKNTAHHRAHHSTTFAPSTSVRITVDANFGCLVITSLNMSSKSTRSFPCTPLYITQRRREAEF